MPRKQRIGNLQRDLEMKCQLKHLTLHPHKQHFDYSRQLFDIVKLKAIEDYDELLDTVGKGHGCEVCNKSVKR